MMVKRFYNHELSAKLLYTVSPVSANELATPDYPVLDEPAQLVLADRSLAVRIGENNKD